MEIKVPSFPLIDFTNIYSANSSVQGNNNILGQNSINEVLSPLSDRHILNLSDFCLLSHKNSSNSNFGISPIYSLIPDQSPSSFSACQSKFVTKEEIDRRTENLRMMSQLMRIN